jgi:hypothetical protein
METPREPLYEGPKFMEAFGGWVIILVILGTASFLIFLMIWRISSLVSGSASPDSVNWKNEILLVLYFVLIVVFSVFGLRCFRKARQLVVYDDEIVFPFPVRNVSNESPDEDRYAVKIEDVQRAEIEVETEVSYDRKENVWKRVPSRKWYKAWRLVILLKSGEELNLLPADFHGVREKQCYESIVKFINNWREKEFSENQ